MDEIRRTLAKKLNTDPYLPLLSKEIGYVYVHFCKYTRCVSTLIDLRALCLHFSSLTILNNCTFLPVTYSNVLAIVYVYHAADR
jgi:hypothetical protein